ncbi:hypothetical protein F4778DRAFT_783591 [Xylariomycetidae sp. FL2044]|nr:hypothetical protein F4778DRAFT_783591 [Xylariomycetidae sp. FL2044]
MAHPNWDCSRARIWARQRSRLEAQSIRSSTNRRWKKKSATLVRPPCFEVKARVLKVLRTTIYPSMPGSHAGEVNWPDLWYAMDAIGFEPTKLRGSAWSLVPCNDELHVSGRTITCPEPHPSTRGAFWEARRFGRRLTRKYGLTGDSFVLT